MDLWEMISQNNSLFAFIYIFPIVLQVGNNILMQPNLSEVSTIDSFWD